jgi:predicted glutamine amidotransferase
MCRLLGIAANEPTEFRIVLREAPRSLAALSREHRDGWGIAVFDACAGTWRVERGVACAGEDERFHRLAIGTRGELLVSHIRQKTIGDTSLVNTHPFARGRWIFAHNGTVKDVEWLGANASAQRLGEIAGETDSELLFAWMLTRLDEAGVAESPATADTDRALGAIARAGRERPSFGAFNFLLSDGATTYAHRFGRTMFLLERRPEDVVVESRRSRDGSVLETPWSPGRTAIFVASERITDEPWQTIDDGTLLRIDRAPSPHWRLVAT